MNESSRFWNVARLLPEFVAQTAIIIPRDAVMRAPFQDFRTFQDRVLPPPAQKTRSPPKKYWGRRCLVTVGKVAIRAAARSTEGGSLRQAKLAALNEIHHPTIENAYHGGT